MTRKPDETHATYDAHLPIWQKLRDVASGEETVKGRGTTYLPMLSGQDRREYTGYVERGHFFNALGRTVDGLTGMLFRKPPQVEVPRALEAFIDDVDAAATPFQAFAETLADEVVTLARAGVLVDFPRVQVGDETRTRLDDDLDGLRPTWRLYKAEAIFWWRVSRIGNRMALSEVRLHETVDLPDGETIPQIRVLELINGRYEQRLLQRDRERQWREVDRIVPQMNGRPLGFIPFIFFSPLDSSPEVRKPPLLDLANANLWHYRLSADYAHGLHAVALPTPTVTGVSEDELSSGRLSTIGPTTLLATASSSAKFSMLEFSGAGLGAVREALRDTKADMAVLGARMLAPEKRQVEAAETAHVHRFGENSVLASISQAVSLGLTRALKIAAQWAGGNPEEASVTLNRDFLPARMDAKDLMALVTSWQGGAISKRTLFSNLQRGEVIDTGQTFEEEQADIETEPPAGMPSSLNGNFDTEENTDA